MSVTFPSYLFFIQMFCSSDCIEEELLKTIMLYGKASGEDTFQSLYSRLLETNVPVHILCMLPQMAHFPRLIVNNVALISLVFV